MTYNENVSFEPYLSQVALTSTQDLTLPELAGDLSSCLHPPRFAPSPMFPCETHLDCHQPQKRQMGFKNVLPPLFCYLLPGMHTPREKYFPPYIHTDPLKERRRAREDMEANLAVLNVILGIVGTGLTTSGGTELKFEWMFLALGTSVQRRCTVPLREPSWL